MSSSSFSLCSCCCCCWPSSCSCSSASPCSSSCSSPSCSCSSSSGCALAPLGLLCAVQPLPHHRIPSSLPPSTRPLSSYHSLFPSLLSSCMLFSREQHRGRGGQRAENEPTNLIHLEGFVPPGSGTN
eukprot:3157484-Rhodomonas_salina.3